MAAQRDYYADLGVSRDADIEDIKKQFRKLGKTETTAPLGLGFLFQRDTDLMA